MPTPCLAISISVERDFRNMFADGFLKIFATNSFFYLFIEFKIGPSIQKLSCKEQTWRAFYKGIYLSDLLLFFPSFCAIFTQLLQISCQNNQLP